MFKVKNESIKNEALRQLIRIDDLRMRQYDFKPAESIEDYFTALKLVQDVYIEEGYVNADMASCPCRILENHFYERTAVFIAKKKAQLVFTVSLFPDTSHGLPMDAIYGKELNHLRAQGRRIGEVGCLATHPDFRDGSQNILMHGNKIMLKYAMEYLKLDDLVITVNPKHSMVYKDVLMFDDIGDGKIKPYPKVNSHPAVALRLNLHEVEEKCRHFYGNNSLETNLHHFLFVKHSSMLELPEKNDIIDNHFARFFTPDTRTGARDILPIQPDDQRGQPIWEAVPFFGTNPVKSSDMGTAIRDFPL